MKKIRIFLINNPLTSLFMASWFKQNHEQNQAGWRNIGIYSVRGMDPISPDSPLNAHEKTCRSVMEGIVDDWVVCPPNRYDDYQFRIWKPSATIVERRERFKDFNRISMTLGHVSVHVGDVKEVWYGNVNITEQLFYMCRHAKGIYFEHGMTDATYAVTRGTPYYASSRRDAERHRNQFLESVKKLIRQIERLVGKLAVFYDSSIVSVDQHVSLLGDEARKANPPASYVKTIESPFFLELGSSVIKNDPCFSMLSSLQGATVIVLLDANTGESREQQLAYYDAFYRYLCDECTQIFLQHDIKNIIFKDRFDAVFSKTAFELFTQDRNFSSFTQRFRIVLLSDYTPNNYSVEYYIATIKPTVLLANFSSALLYCKKIDPDLVTLSCHKWFIDYWQKHLKIDYFKKYYDETFKYEFYFDIYRTAYEGILPEIMT